MLDQGLAPGGQHVLSAYVQFAPYALRDSTWEQERDSLAEQLMKQVKEVADPTPAQLAYLDRIERSSRLLIALVLLPRGA